MKAFRAFDMGSNPIPSSLSTPTSYYYMYDPSTNKQNQRDSERT